MLGTRRGVVKKTRLEAYSNPRRGGIIAIHLDPTDELIAAIRTSSGQEVLIASKNGKSIRFPEGDVRSMGRTAACVRGMALVQRGSRLSVMPVTAAQWKAILRMEAQ